MTIISHDLPDGDIPKIRFDPAIDRARNGDDYGSISWCPETHEYAGSIEDFPFICRRHGYAGQGDCKICLWENGEIPYPKQTFTGDSIPF